MARTSSNAQGAPAEVSQAVGEEVRRGLTESPKSLAPWLFYDRKGSELFEEITHLPEYYLTRTELSLFLSYGAEMISSAAEDEPIQLVELGAGSARKTQVLIRNLLKRQGRTTFYPVDVSRTALNLAVSNLSARFPMLDLVPLEGTYAKALERLSQTPGRRLVLFIGSTIGNIHFEQAVELLAELRHRLKDGDALLLGTDLRKSPEVMLAAYDDASGVTARFNKNILERINRELGGHFDVARFRHVALWNERHSRIEMLLESDAAQTVKIDKLGLEVSLERGERIHTENSYKFTLPVVQRLLEESGFVREQTWMDPRGSFAEHLARVRVH